MVDFQRVLNLLACPGCRGELAWREEAENRSFVCHGCNREFPVIDGIPRFLEVSDPLLAQAKAHWEDSPHFQYEASTPLYTREYYEEQDRWRAEDVDRFTLGEYRFERLKGLTTLDIGCGSGWIVKQSAKHGAFALGVDFTEKAAISTRDALRVQGLEENGLAIQADAQFLPFKEGVIDHITSMGVLHHIPDTQQGIDEAFRVLKPGGTALISLYGELFFFNPLLFPLATFVLRRLLKAPPKRDGIQHSRDFDEFYRLMDGPTNPIGRFYSDAQLAQMFGRFRMESSFRSHFPLRFLRLGPIHLHKVTPDWLYRWVDSRYGMMCNHHLAKP